MTGRPPAAGEPATIRLQWRPTAHQRRLASVAALAALAALLTGRAGILVLAAPLLAALAAGQRGARPATVEVTGTVDPGRCLEADTVDLTAAVRPGAGLGRVELTLRPSATLDLIPPAHASRVQAGRVGTAGATVEARWQARPVRWGRWTAGVVAVRLRTEGGLAEAQLDFRLGELRVYPAAAALRRLVVPASLPDQIGQHVSRAAGSGVEFAAVRPYLPGDPPRRVNWPASLRRGRLHVTDRAAERSAPVVVGVDAFSDVGPFGDSTLDRAVRGATGAIQAYLRVGDRVGFVVLGGVLSWLTPDLGGRQLYRLIEAVLAVRPNTSMVDPDLNRVPPVALPPSALVVLFSPLLDPRAVDIVADLRQRGRPTLVIDILTTQPPAGSGAGDALALRLWRLDRAATRHRLAGLGVPVVGWDGAAPLDQAVAGLARRPLARSRR
jgi:uncharacterized protein (DUF58 family)